MRRLDTWPGQQVQLDAGWSIGEADETGDARLTCHGSFGQPAPGGYQALVLAQQRAIAALAARIAVDARNWADSRTSTCSMQAQAPR